MRQAAAADPPPVPTSPVAPGMPDTAADLPPAALARDPLAWAQHFLPHYFTDPPSDFHREFMAALASPAVRLIARIAPRGHAKSTCAAFAYPLWCLCQQRRRNIVLVTHERALATQFLRDIRQELECNERIRAVYGDLCAGEPAAADDAEPRKRTAAGPRRRKWAETVFTTVTGVTVQAKGAGAAFRGLRVGPQRPDLVICDDLEKDDTVASPARRRKLEAWLQRVVLPALAPEGQLVVLGSLLHHDALLANLRDRRRFPRWDYAVYRAIEARPRPDGRFERVALWPARWPLARLDEERERIGTLAFEQEYQANPADEAQRVFRPEWLRSYDPAALVPQRLTNLLAVDPAAGVSGGDFFALWVGSVDEADGTIYTRELVLERINIVEQVRRIISACARWRPLRVGIETTAYQAALKDVLDDHGRRHGLYLPIVPLRAVGNKRARIEASAVFYENGVFRLPPDLPPEAERQFLQFPKARHDDAPDVCAMGIELARTVRAGGRVAAWLGPRRGERGEW